MVLGSILKIDVINNQVDETSSCKAAVRIKAMAVSFSGVSLSSTLASHSSLLESLAPFTLVHPPPCFATAYCPFSGCLCLLMRSPAWEYGMRIVASRLAARNRCKKTCDTETEQATNGASKIWASTIQVSKMTTGQFSSIHTSLL